MNIKNTILHTVERNGELLAKFEDYSNDREVVLAAVKNKGIAIKYASKELKEDNEVIQEAVIQDEKAYYYIPKYKKEDLELFAHLVRINNNMLRIRNDLTREQIFSVYRIIAKEFSVSEKESLKRILSEKEKRMLFCAEKKNLSENI